MQAEICAALESEKVILQSVLLDNELFYQVERLRPENFQQDYHRRIFSEVSERIQSGQQVDEILLMSSMGQVVAAYIEDLNCSATRKLEPHVQEVLRASHRREIVRTLEQSLVQAKDASEDNASVLSVTFDRLLDIQEFGKTSRSHRLSDYSTEFYDRVERIANQDATVGGLTTGIAALDEMTTGLRMGEYIIVGAYTGEGKSSYVTQLIAANCAFGIKALLFSQEMSKEAVLSRIIPQITKGNIPAWKLRNPRKFADGDSAIFSESKAIVDQWDLWVNDASTLHAAELVSHAHAMVRKHGIKLIVVDYIQLMKADGEKRYDQVSACSGALRELAKGLGVVVVAVSQLARPEGKVKRSPSMFDLKASGELENDAHLILFPWRPIDKKGNLTGKDFIVIGKQREGPVGRVPVVFDSERLMFVPRESSANEEEPETKESWWNK